MEEQSDRLRHLLDQVKFDAPEAILTDLTTHIAEDDPYSFFRYVQDLLECRRIDALLLENEGLWSHVRSMYWERFPWLFRRDLKCGSAVPEEKERNKRLESAISKAFRGVPGDDYKEDWITEYLKSNGLSWEDISNGRHLTMAIPGAASAQFQDPATLLLEPTANMLGLSRTTGVVALLGDDDDDNASSAGSDQPSQPPEGGELRDEDQGDDDAHAMMAQRLPTPGGSDDGNEDLDPMEKEDQETPRMRMTTLITPNDTSTILSPAVESSPKQPPSGAPRQPPPEPVDGPDWLLAWHKATRNGKILDFQQQPYKGWVVSGPVVMLRRIINFLSDEDIDHTPAWAENVAEITEYLAYLVVNHDNEKHSWGYELREAIEMLRTHAAYEDYHYGKPPLTLSFDETPLTSERLPPVGNVNNTLAPRNLLHRLPVGAWDALYKMPRAALHDPFISALRGDEKALWTMVPPDVLNNQRPATEWRLRGSDRAIPVERPYGFNMCETEDEAFTTCMRHGPLWTYKELRRSCFFQYHLSKLGERGNVRTRKNMQLLEFAKFRGASRAAVTFTVRALGSQTREVRSISSPWRRVVVRTPAQRQKMRKFPGVIWKPLTLEPNQVPRDDYDPMAYNFWHTKFLENQGSWAKVKIPDVDKAREILVGKDRSMYPPVPKTNFKGPYTAIEVNEERYETEKLLERMKRTLRDLETAQRLSPRPILREVLINVGWGRQGIPWADETEGMFPDDVVELMADGRREIRVMGSNDVDLQLLERMSHQSINDKMLKLVPKEWSPEGRIFADRVQALVGDISPASIFSEAGKQATLDEVVKAINAMANGPVKGVVFTQEEASKYLDDLESFKRISIHRAQETTYSRPEMTIHPEHTFHWDFLPTARPRPAPRYLTYEELADLSPLMKRRDKERTSSLLRGTAWRLGRSITHLEDALSQEPAPTPEQRAELRNTYRDLTRNWERKVEMQLNDRGARQAMEYRDVIRYAEPGRFRPEWERDDAQVDEGEALGPVYAGILREAHANRSMLWPARWRRVRERAEEKIAWQRDGVWSWARPDIRKSWRYFNVRRWPVHLQREEMQEKIREFAKRRAWHAMLGQMKSVTEVPGRNKVKDLRDVVVGEEAEGEEAQEEEVQGEEFGGESSETDVDVEMDESE